MTAADDHLQLITSARDITRAFVAKAQKGEADGSSLEDVLNQRQQIFDVLGDFEANSEHKLLLVELTSLDDEIAQWCTETQREVRDSLAKLRRSTPAKYGAQQSAGLVSDSA